MLISKLCVNESSYPQKENLPSPLIYFILRSSSLKQQIKISQCSHFLLNCVRYIRGCDVDVLIIDKFPATYVRRKGNIIIASINVKDLHKMKRVISVKSKLRFSFLKRNYINKVLDKIDYSTMKFNDRMNRKVDCIYYPALIFDNCQINRNIIDHFLAVPLCSLIVMDVPNYEYNFDILCYAFTHFKNLKQITVPWQTRNITMKNLLAERKHITKLYSCSIENIPETISFKTLGNFTRNNIKENGILKLVFLEHTIIQPYINQLIIFLENEMSSNFSLIYGRNYYPKNIILQYTEFQLRRCIRSLRYAVYKIRYYFS